jgi:hypothetical protein
VISWIRIQPFDGNNGVGIESDDSSNPKIEKLSPQSHQPEPLPHTDVDMPPVPKETFRDESHI